MALVPKSIVEGEYAEPIFLPCDIPLHLLFGLRGISTGWSTNIPPYNPIEIIDYLIAKNTKVKTPELIPWFRDFKGEVYLAARESKLKVKRSNDEDLPLEEEEENEDFKATEEELCAKMSLVTEGIFNILKVKDDKYDVEITELPIGRYMFDYRKWLEKLREDKTIKKFTEKSISKKDSIYPHYIIEGCTFEPDLKSLFLKKSYGMSNMVLIMKMKVC